MATKRKECDTGGRSSSVETAKKKKYTVSFKPEYTIEFPCIVRGKDSSLARCKICDSEFRIDHAGRDDIRKHVNSKKHQSRAQASSDVTPITSFMATTNSSLDDAVTKSEALFTSFLVEHNIALSASDHASKLFKQMFLVPGIHPRDIIEKFSCGRTKTTAIVHEMGVDSSNNLVQACKTQPFSISTDASNDQTDKLFPLVITYVTSDLEVRTELLSLLELKEKGTGQNIATMIDTELTAHDIPWRNCISLCTDNANIMIGNKTGLYGCLLMLNDKLFSTGCSCHRIHLAAEWASRELEFKAETFFVDIYYYMDKSSNRFQSFKNCQEACGTDQLKVPKHVPTRWLSLGKVTQWVLDQWEPLKSFFKQECEEDSKTRRNFDVEGEQRRDRKTNVLSNLESRLVKLTLLYLNFIIPKFDRINLLLQTEDPLIHRQRRLIMEFVKELQVMVMKPSALIYKGVLDVDMTPPYNFKQENEIPIGSAAKDYITTCNFPEAKTKLFYKSVKSFLIVAIKYLLKNMRLQDPALINAEVADLKLQQTTTFSKLEYFLTRFPVLLPPGSSIDDVQAEFCAYQCEDFPSAIYELERADKQWVAVSQVSNVCGAKKFKLLPQIMCGILAIPHSNATSERIFSLVRKEQDRLQRKHECQNSPGTYDKKTARRHLSSANILQGFT